MIHGSRRRTMAALLVAAATLSACAENVTSPVSEGMKVVGNRSSVKAGFLHSVSQKYSDHGSKPAGGRSGTAAIETRALLGKDGSTLVEASTGSVGGAPVTGTFSKMQVKTFGPDSKKSQTQNYSGLSSGSWSQGYAGLGRNERVQLQGNIRSQDGKRTDVVTVETLIKRRPDLAASNLTGPEKSYVNTPVNFSALVTELNGDVGATANCVLFADGVQADQVLGVWVDSGDAITCAFTKIFATIGTKALRVEVSGVSPSDWDMANNSVTGSIEIVEPSVKLNYDFNGSTQSFFRQYHYSYSDYYSSYSNNQIGNWNYSQVYFNGWTNTRQAQFPLQSVEATVTSDQGAVVGITGTDLGSYWDNGYGGSCWQNNSDGLYSQVCGYGWGQSSVNVQRWAGSATYYSYGFNHYNYYYYYYYWDYSWSYNTNDVWGGGPFSIGNTIAFDVKVTDASGTMYKAAASGIAVNTYPYNYSYSYCYPYYYYYGNYCYSDSQVGTYSTFWIGDYSN